MDLNNFLIDYAKPQSSDTFCLKHMYFIQLAMLDKENRLIPNWFKELRILRLFDYLIMGLNLNKDSLLYFFSKKSGEYRLEQIMINNLSIIQLDKTSKILSSPDIKNKLKFTPEFYGYNNFTIKSNIEWT